MATKRELKINPSKQPVRLAEECFLLKHRRVLMAYFPKKYRVMSINQEAWDLLDRMKDGINQTELSSSEQEFIRELDTKGLLAYGAKPKSPRSANSAPSEYAPTRTALLLTNRCNLRCKYCYSSAGSAPDAELSKEAAFAAVDLIVENARKKGEPATLIFHGGGEPSCAWQLLEDVAVRFEKRAKKAKVKTYTAIATNGVIPPKRLEMMAKHIQEFCISLDGPKEIQDRQRPKANGTGTFDHVTRTLTYLDKVGKKYVVEATVTSEGLEQLKGLVPVLAGRPGCQGAIFAPVYDQGHGTKSVTMPKAGVFIKACRELTVLGRQSGVSIQYVGARIPTMADTWCGATGDDPNFDVTPEGFVSCCYMVTEEADPRADLFIHGQYDSASGKYVFDPEVQNKLRSRSIDTIPECRDCFLRYNCGGGCLNQAKGLYKANAYRCKLNRTLSMDQLVDILRENKK